MADEKLTVTVRPGVTLYVGGSHYAFPAGERVPLPAAHAADLAKAECVDLPATASATPVA
jgi:hypothetical protein